MDEKMTAEPRQSTEALTKKNPGLLELPEGTKLRFSGVVSRRIAILYSCHQENATLLSSEPICAVDCQVIDLDTGSNLDDIQRIELIFDVKGAVALAKVHRVVCAHDMQTLDHENIIHRDKAKPGKVIQVLSDENMCPLFTEELDEVRYVGPKSVFDGLNLAWPNKTTAPILPNPPGIEKLAVAQYLKDHPKPEAPDVKK